MKTTASAMLIATLLLFGLSSAVPAGVSSLATPTARDGRKDFDFLFGSWQTHYRLLRHRLQNDREWYDCYGTSTIRPFWNGSANLEDGDLRCPKRYIAGMTLRLYNAGTHKWSLYWGTRQLGIVLPAQVGHFNDRGVGEFFAHDTYEGRPIVVRFEWMLKPGDHPFFAQAFSTDNGKTWETNWTTVYTRTDSTVMNKTNK
jgi:hypothetical protein